MPFEVATKVPPDGNPLESIGASPPHRIADPDRLVRVAAAATCPVEPDKSVR